MEDEKPGVISCIVAVDSCYFRPTEVETLLGDASKAREKRGWTPKITFNLKTAVEFHLKIAETQC